MKLFVFFSLLCKQREFNGSLGSGVSEDMALNAGHLVKVLIDIDSEGFPLTFSVIRDFSSAYP